MSKHKNYEMIVAKAERPDLVVLSSCHYEGWRASSFEILVHGDNQDYFLCLPQHKEACLHWLNGGGAEVKGNGRTSWGFVDSYGHRGMSVWSELHIFMTNGNEFRTKPKTEKRWIGYCANRNQTIPHPQDSEQLARDYIALHYSYHANEWQLIEIEVEV